MRPSPVGPTPERVVSAVRDITGKVVDYAKELSTKGEVITVEKIQDATEQSLMSEGFYDVARDFILYRAARAEIREHQKEDE